MEGTQTLHRDNGVLQPQAKGSESDTATPELLGPQVRFLPPPEHMQEKPSSYYSLLCKMFISYPSHTLPLTHVRTPLPPIAGTLKLTFPPPVSPPPPPPGFTLPLPAHLPAPPLRPAFSLAALSTSAASPGRPPCKSPTSLCRPRSSLPHPPNSCSFRNIFLFLSVLSVYALTQPPPPPNCKGPHSWDTPPLGKQWRLWGALGGFLIPLAPLPRRWKSRACSM